MSAAEKVCLLTEKLSTSDYQKYAMTILPQTNANVPFADAVKTLNNIFGRKDSLFPLRNQCLKVTKDESESYADFGARVNLKCEKFDTASLIADDFKVLMFVKGLQSTKDSSAILKLLTKLDQQEVLQAAAKANVVVPKMKFHEASSQERSPHGSSCNRSSQESSSAFSWTPDPIGQSSRRQAGRTWAHQD
jgi:hypothetical protein